MENKRYLTEQIITYLGNKRSLLNEIGKEIKTIQKELNKEKLITADLFSGSGVVTRFLKQFSSKIIANDLEKYSYVINDCFLSNADDFDLCKYNIYLNKINDAIINKPIEGIISKYYSPKDDNNIKFGERVFYTRENAIYIDSFRYYIDKFVDEEYKKYFLALLITEASIHTNTAGVFKGFYKDKYTGIGKFGGSAENALNRIKGQIRITYPNLSNYNSEYELYQEDAIKLSKRLKNIDVVYLDPPYNQHPYGSNYFMLNLILDNKMPKEVSEISGIPKDWNHSPFNIKNEALISMNQIIQNLDAKYIVVSYNSEGFITYEEMIEMLEKYGKVNARKIKYNTFRASRNLSDRNIHVNEYLFVLNKEV